MADPQLDLGQKAYGFFKSKGLPDYRAAALAGNFAWESGGRTDNINPWDNKKVFNSPHSFGIAQWNDRLPGLIDYARKSGAEIPQGDLRDVNYLKSIAPKLPLQTQLEYAWNEMQGPEKRAFDTLQGSTDLRSANAGAISYHRPAGWSWGNPMAGHGFQGRMQLADKIMRLGAADLVPPTPQNYDMYGEDVKPSPAPITTGSIQPQGRQMPQDPVTGAWTPEEVIKSRYGTANQFWDTRKASTPIGAIAEGLGGFFGMREKGAADDLVRQNQNLRNQAVQGMAGETDSGALGRRLLGTGIPGLQEQGMQLIAHDAQKKADLQAQGEMQRQRAEHERRLQLDLAKEKAKYDKDLMLETKRLETEDMLRQLKMIGAFPNAPQSSTQTGVPGVVLGQNPAQQPNTQGTMPSAAPVAGVAVAPENPNAAFADDLIPADRHRQPSTEAQAGTALILKQPGKAVDILNEKGKLTEGQTKDASFAERLIRSEAGLREVTPIDKAGNFMKYDPTSSSYRFLPDWNVTNSREWQQYSRNAREGIAAILRKDTGAAVSDTEWNWYFPMYYPQPGDSPQVVRDKQQARIALAKGLRNGSGPAFDQMFPDFDKRLRERLLAQGADLTPKASPPPAASQGSGATADTPKYAKVMRNPQTGEQVGYNPANGKWEKITQPEAPKEGDFRRSIANRGTTTFPEPQDMN